MKKKIIAKIISAALSAAVLFLCFSAVSADSPYSFELSDALVYSEEGKNWSIDISVPKISGTADELTEQWLNAHLLAKAGDMLVKYEQRVSDAIAAIKTGNDPDFAYQYRYEVITDSGDFFVFRTVSFFRSSSMSESSEYWTFDRTTGQLLDFNDVVRNSIELAEIREQIFMEMLKFNHDVGAQVYWTQGDSLVEALNHVGERHHWYFDEERRLVITFDKFEIGPSIVGSPEFTIKLSAFSYMH